MWRLAAAATVVAAAATHVQLVPRAAPWPVPTAAQLGYGGEISGLIHFNMVRWRRGRSRMMHAHAACHVALRAAFLREHVGRVQPAAEHQITTCNCRRRPEAARTFSRMLHPNLRRRSCTTATQVARQKIGTAVTVARRRRATRRKRRPLRRVTSTCRRGSRASSRSARRTRC